MFRRRASLLAATMLCAAAFIMSTGSPVVAAPARASLPSNVHRACAWPPRPGHMACMALVRTDTSTKLGIQPAASVPSGYGPQDLWDAYNLPSRTAGSGQTVTIVDAYDDPKAESDLAVYRSQYGLSPCTTANGCFRKVYAGGTRPPTNTDWAGEISLDLDMVSAICPNCHIRLVEASSSLDTALIAAETMVMHDSSVRYVSNSFGDFEAFTDPSSWPFGSRTGVVVTASTGDDSYDVGLIYPSSDPHVVAVSGTGLLRSTTPRGWNEIAWTGGGSGCSVYQGLKPSWQTDSGCGGNRTVADVSAVADPNTGVSVYFSLANPFCAGWCVFGGTSASAPIIAAAYALAGPPGAHPALSLYVHRAALNDILGGTNSFSPCSPDYLCNAGPGYDGPTGLGTPNGTAAFVAAG